MTGQLTLKRALVSGAAAATTVVLLPQGARAGGTDPIEVRPYERVVINDGDGSGAPVEVQPYEPIAINDDLVVGPLPGDEHQAQQLSAGYRGDPGRVELVEGA